MSRVVLFMVSQLWRGVKNHSPFLHKDTSQSSAKRTLLALTYVSNVLTQVSVVYLQNMDHNSQQLSHMPLRD
jgi:hypothetical protein